MSIFLQIHLLTIVPSLILGAVVLVRTKGSAAHKLLGRCWAICMIASCVSSFGILRDGFSWLHGLAAFTLLSIVRAVLAIRKGNVAAHKRAMIGSYLGSLIAFGFALAVPTRLLGRFLRTLF
jgi:uncharacterized membrane protein